MEKLVKHIRFIWLAYHFYPYSIPMYNWLLRFQKALKPLIMMYLLVEWVMLTIVLLQLIYMVFQTLIQLKIVALVQFLKMHSLTGLQNQPMSMPNLSVIKQLELLGKTNLELKVRDIIFGDLIIW